MQLNKLLQTLVLIELITLVLSIMLSVYYENYLPAELQAWVEADTEAELSGSETILIIIALEAIAVYFINIFGLLGLKPWSKLTYLGSAFILLLLSVGLVPFVEHGVPSVFVQLSTMFSGGIV